MLIEIDFSSDEAIYQQLCNQIILGIATSTLSDGEVLPLCWDRWRTRRDQEAYWSIKRIRS